MYVAVALSDGVSVVADFADDGTRLDISEHVAALAHIALTAAPAVTPGTGVPEVTAALVSLAFADGSPAGAEHLAGAVLPAAGGAGQHLDAATVLSLASAGIGAQLTAGVAAELADPVPDDAAGLTEPDANGQRPPDAPPCPT